MKDVEKKCREKKQRKKTNTYRQAINTRAAIRRSALFCVDPNTEGSRERYLLGQ